MTRRRLLGSAAASLLLLFSRSARAAPASVLAVRVWPARDYTRITLESRQPLVFSHHSVRNPERLVADLEGLELNSVLQSLSAKITGQDPYIQLIRAGQNRPGVVRLVIDLKTEVVPQVFTLKPIGDYGYRLVLDLYPTEPVDPLLALLEKLSPEEAAAGGATPPAVVGKAEERQTRRPPEAERRMEPQKRETPTERNHRPASDDEPVVNRLITIAIDPGHGGEDPGAVGAAGSFEKHVTLSVGRRLKARIDAEPNMRAMLTRDADYFVPLQ